MSLRTTADEGARAAVTLERMREAAGAASALMKTLGHDGRLMILCHLAEGEKPVHTLCELTGLPQSALSQQLARMRRENLVAARRDSQTVHYSLCSGKARQIIEKLYELYCPD
ncbi:MAG: metalloregulator ArsR/SmtB family transcription factor [Pseudomonadota bacterium]